MSGTARSSGGRWVGPLLVAGVVLAGMAVTLLAVTGLRANDRDDTRRVMDQRTAVARSAVMVETGRYLDLLRAVAAGVASNDRLTATDFQAASAPLATAKLVGATSVVFAVPSARSAVPRIQAYWRSHGATGLVLSPQAERPEHVFNIFNRQLNGNEPTPAGIDISASPEAVVALEEARRTGAPTVSDAYVLLRDRNLPPSRQQLSFVLTAPVYLPPSAESAEPVFQGWILMGLRGQDFLGGVLSETSQGVLNGELRATNGDGRQVQVAKYTAQEGATLRREATFPVANRPWTLVTTADPTHLPGARSKLPNAVLLGGIGITATLAWLVYVLATGRTRARNQVLVATEELRTAEAEARRQASLLSAIMASLGDGVGVVDSNGRFLLHNPAAKQLLGVPDDIDGPDGWQEHYGLYHPDGRTPFPVDDLPLVRALRGESSDGVEMLVRNPHRADDILVSVDGRPLDASAGQRGAVAVFHDITELRRYEAELSVFAGVVAHDLKAPLAVIRGHCETALDVLDDEPDSPALSEGCDALRRIANAVDRMAALIDTLLAYTTARDAPLRLQAVPLGPLVADVVAERVGHLRVSEGPVPDIYVGPLPAVTVDPAMLRHVIDNLVGNAIKYVQPDRVPRIDITAAPAERGWARIEVADRGIGIPDDDKPNIFESFHRATSAVGYAGTGLGLAICSRIVERHGGTIGVADNPGGGTRFHFTLPVAERAADADRNTPGGAAPDENRPGGAALEPNAAGRAAVDLNTARPSAPDPTDPTVSPTAGTSALTGSADASALAGTSGTSVLGSAGQAAESGDVDTVPGSTLPPPGTPRTAVHAETPHAAGSIGSAAARPHPVTVKVRAAVPHRTAGSPTT